MDSFMICRSAFCPDCNEAGRPKKGNLFALYKGTGGELITGSVGDKNVWGERIIHGHTPHLFSLVKAIDTEVHFMSNCLMSGCGCSIRHTTDPSTGGITFDFDFNNTKHGVMSVNDWNALVSRWHGYTGYEI